MAQAGMSRQRRALMQERYFELVGTRITERRKTMGVSRLELARRTGLNRDALMRVEKGRANPSVATLVAIATGLGCEVHDLLPTSAQAAAELANMMMLEREHTKQEREDDE